MLALVDLLILISLLFLYSVILILFLWPDRYSLWTVAKRNALESRSLPSSCSAF